MSKVLAVDGNSLVNRAFYGVKPLTTRDGRNTNAVYGFINMLNREISEVKPDYAAIAFDLKSPTFRHKACSYYKANRTGMPPELAEQFEDAKKAAAFLGLHTITCEGFEADDILGTLSSFADDGTQVYIVTGDRDSYQLINQNVFVRYVSTKETILTDTALIEQKYGLLPKQLIQVKALMGDTSDNIPGVRGIGEKTAVDLVKKFGTLENLYENLESSDLITKAVKAKLADGRDSAFESRFLAEIKLDAPIGVSLPELEYHGIQKKELLALCEDLELNSVIDRLSLRESGSAEKTETLPLFPEITDVSDFSEIGETVFSFAYDETDSLIYIKTDGGKIFDLPLTKDNLKKIFCGANNSIALHDLKSKLLYLDSNGISLGSVKAEIFDVMLASYVADPSGVITEERLCTVYGSAGADITDTRTRKTLEVTAILKLKEELSETIEKNGQHDLLYNIEFPLSFVLADMEKTGFLIDREKLSEYGSLLSDAQQKREKEIYEIAGTEFNINSPKQLSEVLFEKMLLPHGKKTKSGYSTDADTLEKLRPYSPIIDEITEYRLIAKLKSTYADGLLKAVSSDGRLHTNFKQALTLTGRLSSADPNLQNIPVRTKEGREFRKVFIPKEGHVLVDADYSQIELRIMAAISDDDNMCSAFESGADIHTSTASQVFGVPKDEVTPEMRKKAKAVNFGIIYGISDFSLAGDIKVTKKEAAQYIATYFEKYPGIKAYLDGEKQKAHADGFVTTLYGRRRYIPELKSKAFMQRMFGERVAMNAPIQGTAADIIKIAMINVYNRLKAEKLSSKLILQVHDELILECPENEAERAKIILKEEMENAAKLRVKLCADVKDGYNWDECH